MKMRLAFIRTFPVRILNEEVFIKILKQEAL